MTCQAGACQCESGVLCNGECRTPDAGACPGESVESTLVTSAEGAYWQTTGALTEVEDGEADVTVDDSAVEQTWEGFGGAFNEMGWYYLSMLGASEREHALQLLYGADGARFVFGRIPIGLLRRP